MENIYSQIDINAYVARYIDENGCSLNQACEELEIDPSKVFSVSTDSDEGELKEYRKGIKGGYI